MGWKWSLRDKGGEAETTDMIFIALPIIDNVQVACQAGGSKQEWVAL
jgi:hypothetical protein